MLIKTLSAVTVIALGIGLSGCSGFKANSEDCSSIMAYIKEVNALVDATNAGISDSSYRRAGANLWSEKLDELGREVVPREPELRDALADWVATSRAAANAMKPNKLDSEAINQAVDAFQNANSTLGSMCSP
jgi:hypothetical protein